MHSFNILFPFLSNQTLFEILPQINEFFQKRKTMEESHQKISRCKGNDNKTAASHSELDKLDASIEQKSFKSLLFNLNLMRVNKRLCDVEIEVNFPNSERFLYFFSDQLIF